MINLGTFSPLTNVVNESNNHSGPRTHTIDRITPHCWVGQVTVENGLASFRRRNDVSSNYIIGNDGRIGGCVREEYRSWCSSSRPNDQRAITIECASDSTSPYTFKDCVYDSLVNLITDICRRYGRDTLVWIAQRDVALNYEPRPNEMLLTVHTWFANKACPGPWLMSRMQMLSDEVTGRLRHEPVVPKEDTCMVETRVCKKGDKNDSVKALQILLKGLGFKAKTGKVLTIDGDFGANTEYAVKNFQASKKMTQDGIVGTKTWQALLN